MSTDPVSSRILPQSPEVHLAQHANPAAGRNEAAASGEIGPLPTPTPLIPEAEYHAISRKAEVFVMYKRRILRVDLEIHGGPYDGIQLPWYCPLPGRGRRPSRSSYFFRVWLMVHRRAPYRGERPSVESLVGKMFRIRVGTVVTDHHKDLLPDGARYSKVSKILERLA